MDARPGPERLRTLWQALPEHRAMRPATRFGSRAAGPASLPGSNADHAALVSRQVVDAAVFLPCRNRILAERGPHGLADKGLNSVHLECSRPQSAVIFWGRQT